MERTKKIKKIDITKLSLENFISERYEFHLKYGGAKVDIYTDLTLEILGMVLEGAGFNTNTNYSNISYSKYLKVDIDEETTLVYKISDHDSHPEKWNRLIEVNKNTSIENIVDQMVYLTKDLVVFDSKILLETWEKIDDKYMENVTGVLEISFDWWDFEKELEKFQEFVKKLGLKFSPEIDEDAEVIIFNAGVVTDFLQDNGFEFEKVIWDDYIDINLSRDYVCKPNGDYYGCRLFVDLGNKKFWLVIEEF